MPLPPINACLVCEDVRPEARGLVSLLGFYGLTPNAEVFVVDFNRPVERLAFYIEANGASDGREHRIAFELRDPGDVLIVPPAEAVPTGVPPPAPTQIRVAVIFTALNLTLRPGRYRIVIRVDGEEHFTDTFGARQAPRQ
jgi:hypothetical protein